MNISERFTDTSNSRLKNREVRAIIGGSGSPGNEPSLTIAFRENEEFKSQRITLRMKLSEAKELALRLSEMITSLEAMQARGY